MSDDPRSPSSTFDHHFRVVLVARSVYPLHGFGGLERHVGDLVRHLLRRGLSVTLITKPPGAFSPSDEARSATIDEFLSAEHLDVRYVPYRTFPFAGRRGTTVLDRSTAYPWFGWRAGRVAAAMVARGQGSIVHALGASGLGYAIERRRHPTKTVPFVMNPQGLEEFGASGTLDFAARIKRAGYAPLRRAVRVSARSADCVIATDRALERAVAQHLNVPPDRIRVIPNAIDLDQVVGTATPTETDQVRKRHGIASDEPVMLSVGRIERNKGYHVLIDALQRLTARRWRWVLVGDGPFRGVLDQLIDARRLRDRCMLTGRLPDNELRAWYETATFFVHPTLYEGSSLVTLEAMAHRLAVVASRAGGLPDKVEPGVSGWLVNPGDADNLAQAIGEALDARDRLASMGQAGARIVRAGFVWPAIIDRQLTLYGELVAGNALPKDHGQ